MCRVVGVWRVGLGVYQPGVYVPEVYVSLKALFLVVFYFKFHEIMKLLFGMQLVKENIEMALSMIKSSLTKSICFKVQFQTNKNLDFFLLFFKFLPFLVLR